MIQKLENWSVQCKDPYSPPEFGSYLQGVLENGRIIITSRIVATDGRIMTTKSGSKYLLGTVDPKYSQFLIEIGRDPNALPTMIG